MALRLRDARPEDLHLVLRFIRALAEYERLADCFAAGFKAERLEPVRRAFDRFDFMQTNRINLMNRMSLQGSRGPEDEASHRKCHPT